MKVAAVAYSAWVEHVLPSAPTLYLFADPSRLNGWGGSLKRLLDIVLAGGAVLVLSPLLLVLALLVRRSSPGPVFFVQERIGKNSQPFPFYKFRTMVHKSDDAIHRQFAAMFLSLIHI